MRRRTLALLLAVVGVLASCGIPTDGEPSEIAQDALPEALQAEQPTPTTAPTDVITPASEVMVVFYDAEGDCTEFPRQLPTDFGEVDLLTTLIEGPQSEEQDQGVTTSLLPDLEVLSVSNPSGAGVVQVQMSDDFTSPGQDEVAKAAGQIVATLIRAYPDTEAVQFVREDGTAVPINIGEEGQTEAPLVETDLCP